MDASTLISFFANSKWQQYKHFVEDYTKFAIQDAEKNDRSIEKYLEFFVDLINRVDYEQKRLDEMQKETSYEKY